MTGENTIIAPSLEQLCLMASNIVQLHDAPPVTPT
jgi:hypothetical protein